jgi:hypothetical protein
MPHTHPNYEKRADAIRQLLLDGKTISVRGFFTASEYTLTDAVDDFCYSWLKANLDGDKWDNFADNPSIKAISALGGEVEGLWGEFLDYKCKRLSLFENRIEPFRERMI